MTCRRNHQLCLSTMRWCQAVHGFAGQACERPAVGRPPCRLGGQGASPPPRLPAASAGELRRCQQLEELTLQHNRLTSVLLSFASLRRLRCGGSSVPPRAGGAAVPSPPPSPPPSASPVHHPTAAGAWPPPPPSPAARSVLHLYDNPLDFLPEISPCGELTHLTVANLRITADPVGGAGRCGGAGVLPRCRQGARRLKAQRGASGARAAALPPPLQAYTKVGREGCQESGHRARLHPCQRTGRQGAPFSWQIPGLQCRRALRPAPLAAAASLPAVQG